MKLTTILLITVILHVSAAALAQKVTLVEKNAPLVDVFKQIRTQTGYDFLFTGSDLKNAKPVTISVTNEELTDVLNKIFAGQPLDFTIENKSVVVREKKETSLMDNLKNKITAMITNIDVQGRVLDEQGLPISSATVTVKGTSNATITDAKGYFTLKNVDTKATIVVSVVGYDKKEVPATNQIGDVKLTVAVNKLDELQIIAYGNTSLRTSTGDVTTIKAETIEKQPVGNVLSAIEGRVPGMFIQQTSGIPGAGLNVQIRGQASLNNGSNPLFVIDGSPYMPPIFLTGGAYGLNQSAGTPLNFINMSDIESIDVLKDADATAIYGSRGANGVVLITTKRGKAGDTKVNAVFAQGFESKNMNLPFLNTPQYIQMRQEAFKNDGLTPGASDYDVNGTWDMNSYTNWQKLLTGNTVHYTDAKASVSGGSPTTNYLVSADYRRESTIFPGDQSDQKGGVHFNLNSASQNNRFKIILTGSFTSDKNNTLQQDLSTYIRLAPDAPAVYTPSGNLNWANSTWVNPLSFLSQPDILSVNNLVTSSLISYEILPGLEIKSNFGYSLTQQYEHNYVPLSSQDPTTSPVNSAIFNYSNYYSYNIEPQISFKKPIGKGMINAVIGSTLQQLSTHALVVQASNYTSDALLQSPSGAASVSASGVFPAVTKYNSIFGRLNYNYDGKYIIDLTGRREGSSRFGPGNQFGDFGSVAGAWIFSEEKWLKGNSALNFGKLRASYGITGNDQIGDYKYLNLYSALSSTSSYQNTIGLFPSSLTNPDFSWEINRKLDFGTDLGFLKDRIVISADYFLQRSDNQLGNQILPSFVGPGSVKVNLPAKIQNTGYELSISTINIQQHDFTWKSTFNFSLNRNKLLSYPNLSRSSVANTYTLGQPITSQKVFHSTGVDPATGIFQFLDSQGNITASPNFATDRTALIDYAPKFFGGLDNSFSYKGFQLRFFLQFVSQNGIDPYFDTASPGQPNTNILTNVWDNIWHQVGDRTKYQMVTSSTSSQAYAAFSNAHNSNLQSINASYVRLNNVSLSYTLPKKWLSPFHLSNAKFYLEGQNLYTFTGFHADPEIINITTSSLLKTIVAGLQLDL